MAEDAANDEQLASAGDQRSYSAERTAALVDAVVAIAMTLLILPLMESVGEVAGQGEDTLSWLGQHADQLVSFVLSFLVIAMFWMDHHSLFSHVREVTPVHMWLTVAWMLTIVWLPVATAITGQMGSDDATAKIQYIGTMIVTSLLSLGIRSYLLRHRRVHGEAPEMLRRTLIVNLTMSVLFALALGLTLVFPSLGYKTLFILLLSAPLQRIIARVLR
jgi:uncharacterized membrane protein